MHLLLTEAKQPKFAAGQNCGNCALFQGKASDASGRLSPVCWQKSIQQRLVLCLQQKSLISF
jgi:hypothetical protein